MAPKIKGRTDYELTARDVLENIGRKIESRRKNYSKHSDKLKGNLSRARFSDGLFRSMGKVNNGPPDSCGINRLFHTNINDGSKDGRDPCDGRKKERFSENEGFECGSKIRDYNKIDFGTSCAPPRRRHICDKNLEFLDNENTENTDDLLGNILVTAKYEGDYIVDHLPDNERSNICTIFARSFADIGDIVRGRDMFKPNNVDAVQEGLKVVFKKIYNSLTPEVQHDYTGDHPNYYKLREDWWNVNRDQVWRALTCVAGEGDTYFIQLDDSKRLFWYRKCGHSNGGDLPTYLDYAPQFLRWFEEWAEEFCRIKKIKMDKTEEDCIGKDNEKDCSREGYNCKETDLKRNEIFMDLQCPDCEKACTSYNEWIENKKKEFNKQKQKYKKEINGTQSHGNMVNGNYYKTFYDELKTSYKEVNRFFDLLNKGKICENVHEKNKIDFNDLVKTFSRSEYCKSCPILGVKCENGQCNSFKDITCPKIKTMPDTRTYKNGSPTDIYILVNDSKKRELFNDLKNDFKECDLFKKLGEQKWNCKYKCNLDVCELQNFYKGIDDEKQMLIDVLIKRWLLYFLKDYNKLKAKLNRCMDNDKNKYLCIQNCYINCECVEKWISKKEKEWTDIKARYIEQYESKDEVFSSKLKTFLKQDMFKNYIGNALNKNEMLDNMKESDGCIGPSKSNGKQCKNNDVITILLNRLEDNMKSCKTQHESKNQKSCDKSITIVSDDDDDFDEEDDEDDEDEPRNQQNPCVTVGDDTSGSSGKIKSVRRVAREMQKQASVRHDGDISKLKADASQGTYRKKGVARVLSNICNITIRHSNSDPKSPNPCHGKGNGTDTRFKIDTLWREADGNGQKIDVLLPPRRRHMCTSNLEYLLHRNKGQLLNISENKINDSFLGDILLAANKEAEWIKSKYKDTSDHNDICRAVRNSFADIGDIIKGTDLWVNNSGEQKTQGNLIKIFKMIEEKLYKSGITKYRNNGDNKHKHLRSDWWEANRVKVWEAMVCEQNSISCNGATPFDDYIPQRLRWITEWAEWYCKAQNKYYGEMNVCDKCNVSVKGDGKCEKGNGECAKCTAKCKQYREKVNKWEDQWKQIKQKYDVLYEKAKQNDGTSNTKVGALSDKDEDVVKFLSKLYKANNDKSGANSDVYGTAAAYVHETAYINNCNTQNVFCNTTGKENYAFQEIPKVYEQACDCNKSTEKKDACALVKDTLNGNNGKTSINGCGSKIIEPYPEWQCGVTNLVNEDDVCMPPRRQKLCLYYLTKSNNLKSEDDIRNNFITCAAIETYFAWNRYKTKNQGAVDQLKGGAIPDEFKRQMFYTFSDYRNIFFGTDISSCPNVKKASENIEGILKKGNDEKKNETQMLDKWRNSYGPEIWEGMLCALTKEVTDTYKKTNIKTNYSYETLNKQPPNGNLSLEDFAKKPQFLRWMIEWGEDFCVERQKKEREVENKCSQVEDHNGCYNKDDSCGKACKDYEKYISEKKEQYEKQGNKFDTDKANGIPEYNSYFNSKASEYLEKECLDGTCKYMKKVTDTSDYWKKPHTTYNDESLQKKCSCPTPPCEIVDKILGNKSSTSYSDGCKHKYTTRNVGWDCGNGEKGKEGGKEDGGACIPPRRKRLYIKDLETLGDSEVTQVQLREAFIKCAAVETFFAWHEFINEKEKEDKEEKERDGSAGFLEGNGQIEKDTNSPQNQLKKGIIHEEFKRQMFYTFADYRDIFFGKDIGNDVGGINEKIDTILQKNGKPNNIEEYKKWWQKHGHEIWEGMLCALSYNTETKEMDKELCNKLTEQKNGNKNTYDTVTISGGPIGNTKLDKFASRPQYFRWLEEWGEEFCRKRTYMLKMIKEDCRKENSSRYCDGDGFDCSKMRPNDDGTFVTLKCPSCFKSCTSYKEWINTKKYEFEKQKKKYEMEITDEKSHTVITYDNEFYKTLKEKYNTATKFLETLKGPYSNNITGESTINFNYQDETFAHAKNCSPCPVFGVKCKEDDCSNSNENMCHEKLFKDIDGIENKENTTDVHMLVIDNNKKEFAQDLHVCEGTGMFDGIRNNKWSCGYLCDYDVCVLQHSKDGIHDKQNIPIIVLFKLWVENFLKDYNKIKEKFSQCINNKNKSICIKGCTNKCKCVGIWIEKKKEEWKNIKERYQKQYRTDPSEMSYFVLSFLESLQTQTEVEKAIKPFKKLNDLHYSNECTATDHSKKGKCENNDIITILLNKLKKEINDYQTQHKGANETLCYEESHADKQTEDTSAYDIPLGVVPPPFCNVPSNPCSGETATNVVGVEVLAKEMQEAAHKNMVDRSVADKGSKGSDSKSVLKGHIKNAQFNNGAKPINLKDACSITKEYTNDRRHGTNDYNGPCTGKDGDHEGVRMKIGTTWKNGSNIQITDPHLFLPPRREHICISNLEKLDVDKVISRSNVNDSFLWDVLLAAKLDAETIKQNYKSQNKIGSLYDENYKETVCPAMKYSFADIGDIIRGKDLWDDDDFKELETKLVTIFGKIKTDLKEKLNDKYDSDPKYTKLRFDWWEANRDEIWNAIQCKTTSSPYSGTTKCSDTPPYDDYIPQRLRWMTEWAEWYCKVQKEAYEVLEKKCSSCKSGKCMNGTDKCNTCMTACAEYWKKIQPWKQQWETISTKYKTLYQQAKNSVNGDTTSSTTEEKDKDVFEFLKKLYTQNKGSNEIYATAEGYVHQELPDMGCQEQTFFCKNPNDNNNKKYAFRPEPYDYDDACDCGSKTLKAPELREPCTIVDEIHIIEDGETIIGCCEIKKKEVFEWQCDQKYELVKENGICIPPRRQQLCLHYLKDLNDQTETKEQDLREAFIKTAAEETILLWQYYNNNYVDAVTQLNNGIIPLEFLRSMFYTFGDYRDICLGTDIAEKTAGTDVPEANENIGKFFSNNGKIPSGQKGLEREEWWNEYAPAIWEGMLCALEKIGCNKHTLTKYYNYETVKFNDTSGPNLRTFSSKPQFFRWFTEWGEDFCKQRKKQIEILHGNCSKCDVIDSDIADGTKTCKDKEKCDACKDQCKTYKEWLGKWKKHYSSQKEKFQLYKNSATHNNGTAVKEAKSSTQKNDPAVTEANSAKDARDYLDKQLQNMICTNGSTYKNCDYKCMNEKSSTSSTDDLPKSFEYPPDVFKDQCDCKEAVVPAASPKKHPPKRVTRSILPETMSISAFPLSVGIAFAALSYFLLKKKSKSSVDLLRVLNIPKGEYGMPTLKSKNRYIPYRSGSYKGKTYIYMEGDTSGDEDKYIGDITSSDITSSESEYEEMDVNDICVPGSPKYKTLIEVVLEPSKSDGSPLGDGDSNPLGDMVGTTIFTDEEWNELKHDFISQYIQSEPLDVPQYDVSTELPMNIREGNVLDDGINEKPFITSIHDKDLYTGEEISYNINMGTNSMDDPKYVSNNVYSGIDLINDTLSGNQHIDIYDEVLKRKENELFGTNYKKNTSNNSVAKLTNNDPIMNQLDLLHKWLDRHRDMCEKWNTKEELLDKLNEQWNKDNDVGGDIPSDSNKKLNTDVSIQIDMDKIKRKKEFSNMDTILDDMEDDIYYDVNDENPSVNDIPMNHNRVDVPKKVHVEMKILNNKSNGSLEQEFPISDVWNI